MRRSLAQKTEAILVIGFFADLKHNTRMKTALPFVITVFTQRDALARLAAAGGRASPFQSAGWLACWLETMNGLADFRLVEMADAGGSTLLPLRLSKPAGVCVARKVGGGHASFFTPVISEKPEALPPEALKAAALALGVDALILEDCPREWAGVARFTATYPPAPDPARCTALNPAAPPAGGEAAKKLRAKVRKLSEMGATTQALSAGDNPVTVLDALLGWKAVQFAARGIADPFAGDEMRRFILSGLGQGALRLFALMHQNHPVAALLLAQAGHHASGMTIAYDPASEIARFSPGDVLVNQTLDILKHEGITGFDLGVGEARYKRLHCPQAIPLVDVRVSTNLKGAMFTALHAVVRRAKGALKGNEQIFATLSALRARLRRRPPES